MVVWMVTSGGVDAIHVDPEVINFGNRERLAALQNRGGKQSNVGAHVRRILCRDGKQVRHNLPGHVKRDVAITHVQKHVAGTGIERSSAGEIAARNIDCDRIAASRVNAGHPDRQITGLCDVEAKATAP